MALLDRVKEQVNYTVGLEEYDCICSIDEEDEIILEAKVRGEAAVIGDEPDANAEILDDEDKELLDEKSDIPEEEDPDLGEDDDNMNFTFESQFPSALEEILLGDDNEDDGLCTLDDIDDDEDDDTGDLLDRVIDALGIDDSDDEDDDDF